MVYLHQLLNPARLTLKSLLIAVDEVLQVILSGFLSLVSETALCITKHLVELPIELSNYV